MMAVMKNNQFGKLSGSIGNLIYRQVEDRTIVTSRPLKYSLSQSEKSVKNRKKLGTFSLLATAAYQDELIKSAWKKVSPNGKNGHNQFTKVNFSRFGDQEDMWYILLLPFQKDFSGQVTGGILADNNIILNIVLSNSILLINEKAFPEICAHGIMKLSDSAPENPMKTLFLPLTSISVQFRKLEILQFLFLPGSEELHLLNKYPVRTYLINLVIKTRNGSPEHFSENIMGIL